MQLEIEIGEYPGPNGLTLWTATVGTFWMMTALPSDTPDKEVLEEILRTYHKHKEGRTCEGCNQSG